MRIISGSLGGRRLHPPSDLPLRPTTDFAKEALFNVLNNLVTYESLRVLDLFAGTGSISLEFVSRGAKAVTAVDNNPRCIGFMHKVSIDLKIPNLYPRKTDVFTFLKQVTVPFDLVFADPPYNLHNLVALPGIIFAGTILKTGGMFILEHPKRYDFTAQPHFSQHRKYGNVNFSFFAG